jgi:hypothetical protein
VQPRADFLNQSRQHWYTQVAATWVTSRNLIAFNRNILFSCCFLTVCDSLAIAHYRSRCPATPLRPARGVMYIVRMLKTPSSSVGAKCLLRVPSPQLINIALLRSFGPSFSTFFYKHSAPTGARRLPRWAESSCGRLINVRFHPTGVVHQCRLFRFRQQKHGRRRKCLVLQVDLIIQMVNRSHPVIEKTRCGSLKRSCAGSLPVVCV